MADVGIKITASDQTGSAFNSVATKLGAVKKEAAGLGDTVGGLVGTFSALGITLGTGLSVAAVKNAIDTADAFSKMAQKTGVAVEQLRELNYAASLSDVSTEALGTGLRKLSVAMAGAAGGNKEQVAIFKALGVNVKDASGSLKGADAVLNEVAAKFASFKDGPEKAALAVQVFGKSGAELIPLLNAGASGLSDMAQEARDLGAVFSGDMAKQAEAFNDNLTRIGVASQGAFYSIANELLPTLNQLSQAFLDAQKSSSGFGGTIGGALKTIIEAAVILYSDVEFVLKGIGREFGAVGAQMAALARADFKGFAAISEAVKADGVRARAELDKFQYDLLNAGILTSKAGAGRGTAADPRILGSTQTSAPIVHSAAAGASKTISEAAKGLALYNDLMDQASGFEKTWTEDVNKLRAALDGKTISQTQFNTAVQALLAIQPGMVAAAKAEADWQKEAAKAYEDAYAAQAKAASTADEALQNQLEQNAAIGLTVTGLADLEAAKLTDQALSKDSLAITADLIDFSGQLGAQYRAEARALRDLASAKISGAQKRASVDAAKDMAAEQKKAAEESKAEWDKYADQIGQSLTDQIMEGGRNGADYLTNLFRTLVLRPIIQGAMAPIAGAATSSLFGSVANAATGQIASQGVFGSGGISALSRSIGSAVTTSLSGFWTGLTGSGATAAGAAQMGIAASTAPTSFGIGQALAGIGPAGWAAMAALAVAAIASGRGETRMGATYYSNADGTGVNLRGGPSGGEIAATQARSLFEATELAITDTLKKVGSAATLKYFDAGLESSKNGKGFTYSGGTLSTGKSFGVPTWSEAAYMNNRGSKTAEQAMQEFTIEMRQSVLQALQTATDIPKTIADQLKGVNIDTLSSDALTTLEASIQKVIADVDAFNVSVAALPFDQLKTLSFDAASGLIAAAGGLETLGANLATYYQNFYSAEEQRLQTIKTINAAAAGSGLDAATATRESFRKIVEAQDLTTESGRTTYAALISVSGAFAGLTPVVADATQVLEDAAKIAKAAADSAASALQTVATQYQSFVSAAASSKSAVDSAKDAITQGYLSAQDAVASAQAEIASVSAQAGQALLGFAQNIRTFIAGLDQSAAGGFGLKDRFAASQADFSIAVAQARSGDKDAMSKVVSLAGSMLSLGQEQTASAADYRLLVAQTKGTLDGLATSTESANAAAKAADPMVAAQAKLLAAQKELNAWSKAASESGASTDRQITDYAADWRTANTAYQQALADLATADDLTQGLDLALGTPLQNIANALEALGISIAQKALTQSPSSAAKTAADAALKATGSKVTEAWVNTSVGDVWASTGGATGVKDASGLDAMVYGKNGFSGTVSAIQSSILDWWNNTPNASALTLYQKAIETGISASTLDAIMGWPKGKSNEWAVTNGLPKFAAGGDHSGGWALVGEQGPELAYMPPAHIYPSGKTGSMLGGNTERLERLVEGLTAEVKRLQAIVRDGNDNTRQLADQFDNVTEGGNATRTVSV